MRYEHVDLDRLDETAGDLGDWPDVLELEQEELRRVRGRDERLAQSRLYPRVGRVEVAPIDPPLNQKLCKEDR